MTRVEMEVSTVRKSFLEVFRALIDIIERCEKCGISNESIRDFLRATIVVQEDTLDLIRDELSEE